jgi:regulator of sigma E protease
MMTVIAFFVCIGVLVSIHEYGHFWVARRCGVKVLRFSVGFGPQLATKLDRHGTEWAISAIPLGGYVKMLDTREAPVADDLLEQTFNSKTLLQRSLIVVAGPVANLLLAIILLTGLNLWGTPALKPIIASPASQSAAAQAGLQVGDELIELDGEALIGWADVRWALLKAKSEAVRLTINRAGVSLDKTIALPPLAERVGEGDAKSDVLTKLGLLPQPLPMPPVLAEVSAQGAAAKAGLQAGDTITAIGGKTVSIWSDVTTVVRASANKTLTVTVLRNEQSLNLTVTPEAKVSGEQTIGQLGVRAKEDAAVIARYTTVRRYDFFPAIGQGVSRTWDLASMSLTIMGKMLIGQASLANLSGPLTMADYAGQTASLGLATYLGFVALISVSIGVLNLLPIPMLDGGHLLYHLIEWVRGKPLSESVMARVQQFGMALLFLLMGIAFYNDLLRYLFKP